MRHLHGETMTTRAEWKKPITKVPPTNCGVLVALRLDRLVATTEGLEENGMRSMRCFYAALRRYQGG